MVYQNNETAAMLVYQTNLLEVEFFLAQTLRFVAINMRGGGPRA